jgi:iron complex outermembrane receptor protein
LHYETSFETVTGKKQDGDYLPLIPANNWTIRTEFSIKMVGSRFCNAKFKFTFNQNNVSGFETSTNGYTLVNLGFGESNCWKNIFLM